MGNTPKNSKNKLALQQELRTFRISQEEAPEQNYIETSQCCWMQISSHKKRKIIWENNFIAYCEQIKNEFKWAGELSYLVRNNIRSKAAFFKQLQQLRTSIKTSSTTSTETQRQILITPSEVEQFKSNLKKSVLLSSSQANKYHDSSHKLVANMGGLGQRPSRIQFNRFNNSGAHRRSTAYRKVQSRRTSFSSNKSGLRKSIMSFVDDTLSSVFGAEREISKQMANNLEIFLKFSMMLEKHFNNPDCMFFHIRRKFIDFVCLNYTDTIITTQIMAHFVDSINQFMVILKEAIIDYYHLTSFGEGQQYENPFISNQQNILSLCRTLFFKDKNFYGVVFNNVVKFNAQRQANFAQILKLLDGSSPETFYVKDKFCLNHRTLKQSHKDPLNASQNIQESEIETVTPEVIQDVEPYRQCKLILNELQKSMTPVSKMKIMLHCSEMMNKQIQKFYDVNGIQRQKWVLDADQVLSIFCYLIVGTKIEHLHSHLFIMDNFSTNSQMISIFGYYLSVMNCAVEQLESDYLDKIKSEQSVKL